MATIDLTSIGTNGIILTGDNAYDNAGYSVSGAGDINGDGLDDFYVAAPRNDDGGNNAGKAYLIFGKASGWANVDLGALGPADGFTIQGAATFEGLGFSGGTVGAGDINGDGFEDLIIGTRYGGGAGQGRAYVLFGKASGFANIDLATLSATDGFYVEGEGLMNLGNVSTGDFNNDGVDDLVIGGWRGSAGGTQAGVSYVIFGKESGLANIDLGNPLAASDGFLIKGAFAYDYAGYNVASAGDINGDGFDDVIVGARSNDDGGSGAGAAYVLFGKAAGFGTIDLESLAPADGFKIQGDAPGDYAGADVAAAGDVNGDGIDDFMVSATQADGPLENNIGRTYVIFGKTSGWATFDLTGFASADGFMIVGDSAYDNAGHSISSAGDFNGDGFDDLLIGVHSGDDGGAGAGEAYVVFGKASGFATIDLGSLADGDGIKILGDSSGDNAGRNVSGVGDVNGDGFADILVGAPFDTNAGGNQAGAAYLIFGFAVPMNIVGTSAPETFSGGRGNDTIQGMGGDDVLNGLEGNDLLEGGSENDTLNGGPGDDEMRGGTGNDIFFVGSSGDVVVENVDEGTDEIRTNLSVYSLASAANVEKLTGLGTVNQTFSGTSGADVIDGGHGADAMTGFSGNDTYFVDNAGDIVVEGSATGGVDLVNSTISLTLWTNVDNLTLLGSTNLDATGNALDNFLTGNSGNNQLDGGTGGDKMAGGNGNDTYHVDSGRDRTYELAGGGVDLVITLVSQTLMDEIENLTLGGTSAIKGFGNALNNIINGNSNNNVLNGLAGADTMIGKGGNDTYVVDNAGDVVTEIAGQGTDTVQSSITFTLQDHFEDLKLSGPSAINGTGNSVANVLTGNGADNVLNGMGGADKMVGGFGSDTYIVDNVGDTVRETTDSGTDSVQSSVTFNLSIHVENITLTGSAHINSDGNTLANLMIGNSGNNQLRSGDGSDTVKGAAGNDMLGGGNGADSLYGGVGLDTLTGGAGADGFYFDTALNEATNFDDILDFVVADDTIFLDRNIFSGIDIDGALSAGAFRAGSTAIDADDRILYDQSSGNIYYDADGVGGSAAIFFASVTDGTALTRLDFTAYTG